MGRGAEQIKWPIHLEVNLYLRSFCIIYWPCLFFPCSRGVIHASYWIVLLFCHKYCYCTTVRSIVPASFMLHISTWWLETWECCCTTSTRCWIWKTKMMSSISMPLSYSTAPLQPDGEYRKRKKSDIIYIYVSIYILVLYYLLKKYVRAVLF